MPLQPSQVTSRANDDLLAIERVLNARHIPSAERMVRITLIAEAYRRNVEGCTADPFRNSPLDELKARTLNDTEEVACVSFA